MNYNQDNINHDKDNDDDDYYRDRSVIDFHSKDNDIDKADLIMYKNNRCHAYLIGYPPDCKRYIINFIIIIIIIIIKSITIIISIIILIILSINIIIIIITIIINHHYR